ncbi:hypothetical protein FGG08_002534 [Glutinoglossum americanum]|uniref:Uncharacterized protein n=1 Tax=Glutinoglossum americanum TaxID=1670608 RepID=A0A9P8I631_9PEZI|nr:hypothetical protein FGG08_002534 [Glutinoglossum americanum]
MAPIRRYLRISKYSVLECRIYLENPRLVDTWLLNPRDPVLPRIFECVRPLVLPKLREENERARGKGRKANRGIKDVIAQDDFEVSIFLTDVSTRHSLLTKQKVFGGLGRTALVSSSKPTLGTSDSPVDVDLDAGSPVILREESTELDTLESIPIAVSPQRFGAAGGGAGEVLRSQSNEDYVRQMGKRGPEDLERDYRAAENSSSSDAQAPRMPHRKRKKPDAGVAATINIAEEGTDDKKEALRMLYDGFSIYGRILCLVVRRKPGARARGSTAVADAGQAVMEDWIVSTQIQREDDAS